MEIIAVIINNDNENTSVSNIFFDEYLKRLNDAQVKVYLLVLRYSEKKENYELEDIAEILDYSVEDIKRAFFHLGKVGLLDLKLDDDDNIVSVGIVNLKINSSKAELFELVSSDNNKNSVEAGSELIEITEKDGSNSKNDYFPVSNFVENKPKENQDALLKINEEVDVVEVPEKGHYGSDAKTVFERKYNGKEIAHIAESYLRKPLSSADFESLIYICVDLGLSQKVVDRLMQYCCEDPKTTRFSSIERYAITWYREHIETEEDAVRWIRQHDRRIRRVLVNGLGRRENWNVADEAQRWGIKWFYEDGFSEDLVMYACGIAVRKNNCDLGYVDGILKNLKEAGVKTVEEAKKNDFEFKEEEKEKRAQKRENYKGRSSKKKQSEFFNIMKNETDYDELFDLLENKGKNTDG